MKHQEPHPLWPFLDGPIGLVSLSPRRAEILESVHVPFEVIAPRHADEDFIGAAPAETVMELAKRKLESVEGRRGPALRIAADTVVVIGKTTLGKPADERDAARMLRLLSGNEHTVYTGIHVSHERTGVSATGYSATSVLFRKLSETEIDGYIAGGEPMDKAGAYGIQGMGALLVEGIRGCYRNVVGLPLVTAGRLLREVCIGDRAGGVDEE